MVSDNKRERYQGEEDAWTRAIELVATPVVAGGIGFGVDRFVGTMPLFTIALGLLAVVATFVKIYYTYDAEMRAHEAASPWGAAARARQEAVTAGPAAGRRRDSDGEATIRHGSAGGLGGS